MKRDFRLPAALLGAMAIIAGALVAATAVGDGTPEPSGPPPLVIDKDAPLLLDELTEPQNQTTKKTHAAMENQACYVCHLNYKEEPMASWHTGANIGCVECHGKSYPHRNDENNITPPDIMYPADEIDPACAHCHTTHDVAPVEVIERWLERCYRKRDPRTIVCTDCHGDHRLKMRTVRWDKLTGKLLRGGEDRPAISQKTKLPTARNDSAQ